MVNIEALKAELDSVINKYANLFSEKYELPEVFWVRDRTGEIGAFGDLYLSFDTVRFCIEEDIEPQLFYEYYDAAMEGFDKSIEVYCKINKYGKTHG